MPAAQFVQATLVQVMQACISLRKFYSCLRGVLCNFCNNSHIYKESLCLREAGVGGSNPLTPTRTTNSALHFRRA